MPPRPRTRASSTQPEAKKSSLQNKMSGMKASLTSRPGGPTIAALKSLVKAVDSTLPFESLTVRRRTTGTGTGIRVTLDLDTKNIDEDLELTSDEGVPPPPRRPRRTHPLPEAAFSEGNTSEKKPKLERETSQVITKSEISSSPPDSGRESVISRRLGSKETSIAVSGVVDWATDRPTLANALGGRFTGLVVSTGKQQDSIQNVGAYLCVPSYQMYAPQRPGDHGFILSDILPGLEQAPSGGIPLFGELLSSVQGTSYQYLGHYEYSAAEPLSRDEWNGLQGQPREKALSQIMCNDRGVDLRARVAFSKLYGVFPPDRTNGRAKAGLLLSLPPGLTWKDELSRLRREQPVNTYKGCTTVSRPDIENALKQGHLRFPVTEVTCVRYDTDFIKSIMALCDTSKTPPAPVQDVEEGHVELEPTTGSKRKQSEARQQSLPPPKRQHSLRIVEVVMPAKSKPQSTIKAEVAVAESFSSDEDWEGCSIEETVRDCTKQRSLSPEY